MKGVNNVNRARLAAKKTWRTRKTNCKVTYKTYRLLDGSHKKLLSRIGSGQIIRLFDKTPYPKSDIDIVCPHFMQLACIYGCPYNCSFCFLKGTLRFFQKENGRIPVRHKKRKDIVNSIETFLSLNLPGKVLNTSELADGLAAESNVFYGRPFSEFLMERFKGTLHKILFLSKGTNVKNFLENDWQKNVILSWSINAHSVAERWEKSGPKVEDRLQAAKSVSDRGYEVRLRIDPMVAIQGYEEEYRWLVDDIFSMFTPEKITLGCLRGLPSTIARAKDKSWTHFLTESSNWGRKPSIESRLSLYSTVIEHLRDNYHFRKVAVCKDTLQVWRALKEAYGLDYTRIQCNCA